jgi:hypothetical protein
MCSSSRFLAVYINYLLFFVCDFLQDALKAEAEATLDYVEDASYQEATKTSFADLFKKVCGSCFLINAHVRLWVLCLAPAGMPQHRDRAVQCLSRQIHTIAYQDSVILETTRKCDRHLCI